MPLLPALLPAAKGFSQQEADACRGTANLHLLCLPAYAGGARLMCNRTKAHETDSLPRTTRRPVRGPPVLPASLARRQLGAVAHSPQSRAPAVASTSVSLRGCMFSCIAASISEI